MTISVLDSLPADIPSAARGPATLLVHTPQARQRVDTAQMAYTLRPHHLAYYSRNAWAEPPPQMLQPLLVRTFEASGRFTAVYTPPTTGASTYALRTELLELVHDYTQEPPVVRLAVRLQLSDEQAHRMVATREIRQQEAMAQRSPQAGVTAANAALARALREAASFVIEATP